MHNITFQFLQQCCKTGCRLLLPILPELEVLSDKIKAIFLSSPYYLKLINVIFRVREQVNSPFLYFVNLLLFNILGFFVGHLFVCLEEKQFPTLQW